MALYLVGETLDKHRAHAAAQAGDLVALYRGVYVDAKDDIDMTVVTHAVRIATYLYPQAYLSGASALSLATTEDGRLFLSGRRNARTRIRALEIIQNQAPSGASTVPALVADDMGEFSVYASSPRQRFLEAFRKRSEHASAITPSMRRHMAERLMDEYGGAAEVADALWTLARANGWIREAEAAEHYLKSDLRLADAPVNRSSMDLVVAWHGEVAGHLLHDGAEWRWVPDPECQPSPIRQTQPGRLPPFIESLLPEGWLAEVLNQRDDRETLRTGSRYMSNITILPREKVAAVPPADIIDGRLAYFTDAGRFTGRYRGPAPRSLQDSFQEKLARLFETDRTPRLSGIQIKAPMYLSRGGDLVAAVDVPFTHILKPAGNQGYENIPIVEWISLSLARAAAFDVPDVALVEMPDNMPPALLVERFDIRRSGNDTHRLALEDFCSVLDLPSQRKYEGTIERIGRGLRGLSTDPAADMEMLYQRALFAWLIADGDMHLKNLGLLKIAEAGATRFTSVRLAPVYDAVTTRVFPRLEHDRMAFKVNGKDNRLTPDDFYLLARTLEISQQRAAVLLASCSRRVVDALPGLELPALFADRANPMLARIGAIVEERAEPFI